MIVDHAGVSPRIDPSASVAASAVVSGDVTLGPGTRILHGAVVSGEQGPVTLGADVLVMENAVVKSRSGHACTIGDAVMVGPHAHISGASIGAECFIATGASVFPTARLGDGCEVRIGGVVQVGSLLEAGTTVPIGWVAVGHPARLLSPDRHEEIWRIQKELNFPGVLYGVERATPMRQIMREQSELHAPRRESGGDQG
ncbi:gamma carbonic anhydrase family protein [Demequina zhanjiangensis]|uniref:Gamma carbonic anhydrase family protein n=1 Tax=Demequina zhanjiangensis TaxID=3051659 RepID=A0ABT8FYH1_9MICO|nr:gamma carbonic anhydrase family protein [Demequina sp. SYSU T00b26]MDN4471817.1 gamma carbonic anhydrase family protein [Demequina sp. SYSU T00b26]